MLGGIFRKVWKVIRPHLLEELLRLIGGAAIGRKLLTPDSPDNDYRLLKDSGVWRVGGLAGLTLQVQTHHHFQGRGYIQYSQGGSAFKSIDGTSFDGDSPFPFSTQNTVYPLALTPLSPGNFKIRIRVDNDAEPESFFTNEVRAKVLTTQEDIA